MLKWNNLHSFLFSVWQRDVLSDRQGLKPALAVGESDLKTVEVTSPVVSGNVCSHRLYFMDNICLIVLQ